MINKHHIGDVVFTVPSYYLLREYYPEAQIDFFVRDTTEQIPKGLPGVGRVIALHQQIYHEHNFWQALKETSQCIRSVKQGHYQLVIDFSATGETALLSLLSGARERWGIVSSRARIRPFIYTKYTRICSDKHFIDQYRNILAEAGLRLSNPRNEFFVPAENEAKAKELLAEFSIDIDRPYIFIQPFTNGSIKNWPLERYITCAERWTDEGIQVLFGGGPRDRDRLRPVADRFPVAAGKADLLTSAGLMKFSRVIIGADTGLLHLAVALQKRVIMLMAATSPILYGPYGHPDWVVQPAAPGTGMEGISVDQVLATAAKALDVRPPVLK